MAHLEDWLTLYLTPGLGPTGCRNLIDHFGSPTSVLKASRQTLMKAPGRPSKKACEAIGRQDIRDAAHLELARTAKAGISLLCWDDDNFPNRLLNIPDPPILLYVKGCLSSLCNPGVAIVGSRAASAYGLKMSEDLAKQLARSGLTVISGLALGIDAAAHRGTLAAGGTTIAVLGCGLDVIYPTQNRKLFEMIPKNGAIVSEYPMG
ncbi:MAG: DNA-protecting protein DprA, partial [Desulfobulbaceae bacterium]|nr:DNA-protecting protein DprA [Desulfobulbaceae bacterium]